ncbi:MAG TPA: hypothetical protein VFY14_07365 [Streptomyces sp.]|nr:hypothetical protein [Streptomyces sp.]
MSVELSSVIAATTQWLVRSYPAAEGVLSTALAEAQARQAVTVAAWLRHPTPMDAALAAMTGPGGAHRLDRITGAAPWVVGPRDPDDPGHAWRTWVDEVLASWAACLLTSPSQARAAVARVAHSEHARGMSVDFRRLTAPTALDRQATPLLRHPDLVARVAELHRAEFLRCLKSYRKPDSGAAAVTAD